MKQHAWKIVLLLAELLVPYCCGADLRAVNLLGSLSVAADERSRTGDAYQVLTPLTTRGLARRRGYFSSDPRLPHESAASEADYAKSGWDIGHLADFAAYAGNQALADATFTLSNAAPMSPKLNRGLWARIESRVREEVQAGCVVYVVTSPLWIPDGKGVISFTAIGKHGVWVPTHFAKSVLVEKDGKPQAMRCWIVPNAPPAEGDSEIDFRAAVDEHEFWRGRDLFAWVEDRIENQLEATK